METLQDSMVVLTNKEYQHLREQQAHYFTVNKDVNQIKEAYFKSGYYYGCFYGTIFGICCVLLLIMIKNTFSKIKWFKTKKNEE